MKNLIIQFYIKDSGLDRRKETLYHKCMTTVKRYANNIGWDYVLEDTKYFPDYDAQWQLFKIFESNQYDHYDRIVILDSDVFIRNITENVFEKYKSFSACREVDNPIPRTRPEFVRWGNEYFNTGVLVIMKEDIQILRNSLNISKYRKKWKRIIPGRDQMALNAMIDDTLNSWQRINRKDVCFLREHVALGLLSPVVHVAGRCRDIYHDDMEFWDNYFDILTQT